VTQAAASQRWQSHGFGLAIDSDFAVEGWAASRSLAGRPAVRLGLASRSELLETSQSEGSKILAQQCDPAGQWQVQVRFHPSDGYLMDHSRLGVFQICPNAEVVRCAPSAVEAWRWQRYLVGQVLPLVSVMHGLEPFHASAVTVGNVAIAVMGASGQGKSSLVAELSLLGAQFLADDVLALQLVDDRLVAHPGAGLLSLRWPTVQRLGSRKVAALGKRLGFDEHGVRLAVVGQAGPVPLVALYHLEAADAQQSVGLVAVPKPDPRLLLGGTFISILRSRERLVRQLDTCAAIASAVRVVRVPISRQADYAAVARQMLDDTASGDCASR
jgi:hypothetical protein